MALPIPTKTWILTTNNRITFVSLIDTMQKYLYGLKEFLKANGYAVKGSCSAGTGAMDGVDRWASAASVTPRGASAATSQAWVVLTDLNGVDTLLAFQGGSDDVCRVSFSPTGIFVAAGTPNQQPTATDEQIVFSTVTVIGSAASGDRIWNGWVDSTSKLFRSTLFSGGLHVGRIWGIEQFDSHMDPVVTSKAVFGWGCSASQIALPNGSVMQTGTAGCRFVVGGTVVSGGTYASVESFPDSGATFEYSQTWGLIKPDLQGSLGYPIFPLTLCCQTAGARGKMGNWIDCWQARLNALPGDTYGIREFIAIGGITADASNQCGAMWPWDGVSDPVIL